MGNALISISSSPHTGDGNECSSTQMDESTPSDKTDEPFPPIEDSDHATVTDGAHVLNCRVDVMREYKQRYDSDEESLLIGPASHEEPASSYSNYDCSCGAHFVDQEQATQHLIDAAED